ncbi:tryptophan synthase beta subunit-like PLP-dependent enzyme [Crepidotus variabilis]|uniref:Tryptophan synthase beta subunit-like PLP-dependent enzyme n=1 Tax=Crepidotus variabilis TaxID=179855 RepID=A0A9P6JSZ4_9AGAR|nr:tryptophan synthase beta subunit-like PLP-dependent enzyme [Crepidotus variabilis]
MLNSALDAIGCTLLIGLDRLAAAEFKVSNVTFVRQRLPLDGKIEFFNPGESVKDRKAYRMIVEAEDSGVLIPGKSVLIETTTGNAGVGLAWIGLLKAIPNAVMLDQFKNANNARAHELTTGPELIEAKESTISGDRSTSGKIDAFFAGCGTGGTLAGVSKAVEKKKHNPEVKIIACNPIGSIIARPEELNDPDAPLAIEGMGLKFIPETVEYLCIDQWVKVLDQDGYK